MAKGECQNLNGGYVKWSQMVVVMIALFGGLATFYGYVLGEHSRFPHKGAAKITDLLHIQESVKEIKGKVNSMDEKIDGIIIQLARTGLHEKDNK